MMQEEVEGKLQIFTQSQVEVEIFKTCKPPQYRTWNPVLSRFYLKSFLADLLFIKKNYQLLVDCV